MKLFLLSACVALAASTAAPPAAASAVNLDEIIAAISCKANTYYWGEWQSQHYCVACPAGTVSKACKNCKTDRTGKASCTKPAAQKNCKIGTFFDSKANSCASCPSGKWQSQTGSNLCYGCPKGLFQPYKGMHSCYRCPSGKFSGSEGSSTCSKCNKCNQGYAVAGKLGDSTGKSCTCTKCGVGTWSSGTLHKCYYCPAGRFMNQAGSYFCYFCPKGKYQPAAKSGNCMTCSSGRYSKSEGSKSCDGDATKYTVSFRGYAYDAFANQRLAATGWTLMTFADIHFYQDLLKTHYKMNGGLSLLDSWTSTGCCLSTAEGFRVIAKDADGAESFVFPAEQSGLQLKCDIQQTYSSSKRYELLYYDSKDSKFKDLHLSASLGAASGTGECALKRGERNPGIYMGKTLGVASEKHCIQKGATILCLPSMAQIKEVHNLEKGITMSPTPRTRAPTPSTKAPTKAPVKTNFPTPQATATPNLAIDCLVYPWDSWSSCSKTCGSGFQQHTRSVRRDARGGKACPALSESRPCNTKACPVDCQVSTFSAWSQCTKSCGTGTQWRGRSVDRSSEYGGNACPKLTEKRDCNTGKCPVDCKQTAFSQWQACSKSCGGGLRYRFRTTQNFNSYGGKACGKETETASCNSAACAVDCKVGKFGAWTKCTRSCGVGYSARTRKISQVASATGVQCPVLSESKKCNVHKCPIDCVMGQWGGASACSKSCGTGTTTKTRAIDRSAHFGGKACQNTVETTVCQMTQCPRDCTVTRFGVWSPCTKACGGGAQTRKRTAKVSALFGGRPCAHMSEVRRCNQHHCPVACKLGSWTAFSKCTRTCGSGVSTRSRPVLVAAAWNGLACEANRLESAVCNKNNCPVDCIPSAWSKYSACSKSCDTGFQLKTRSMSRPNAWGGKPCGAMIHSQKCNSAACPVDCVVGKWQAWSKCSATCGKAGKHTRQRAIYNQASNGGKSCPTTRAQKDCNVGDCPVHCTTSAWETWTSCSKSCEGTRTRRRTVVTHATVGGYSCPSLEVSEKCGGACPKDCQMSKWAAWGKCTKSCDGGIRTRVRKSVSAAVHGGKACGVVMQTQACNAHVCPVDCKVSAWTKFAACSKTCGTGKQTRYHSIQVNAAFGGKDCPILVETKTCNSQGCPSDCIMSEWGFYGQCTKSCGSGSMKTRRRSVASSNQSGGKACGALSQTIRCNDVQCPKDCVMKAWGSWSKCSKTCGNGMSYRYRTFIPGMYGGANCGKTSDSRKCGTNDCPQDCQVTAWSLASKCTKTCAGGFSTKTRKVTAYAIAGGRGCPALTSSTACNLLPCPIDCALGAWTAFGYKSGQQCSRSCGAGTALRIRKVFTHAAYGGKSCLGAQSQHTKCNLGPCPSHCEVSSWTMWSKCTKTCGTGSSKRSREITSVPQAGGYTCPSLSETKQCATAFCPVDCNQQSFDQAPWSACTKSCATGTKKRVRQTFVAAKYGGKACSASTQIASCNSFKCPIDCVENGWTQWTKCTKSCATGRMTRYRAILMTAQFGGKACSAASESSHCNTKPCPVNCKFTYEASWSKCTKTCGTGYQRKSLVIITNGVHGGVLCPSATHQTRECNTKSCPVDCVLSAYSQWTPCTKSCGHGTQSRIRSASRASAFGGKACGSLVLTLACNDAVCPVNCAVSSWSSMSKCSTSCGSGTQMKTRKVLVSATNGGVVCPTLVHTIKCNSHSCPSDCKQGIYGGWTPCSKSCGTGFQTQYRNTIRAPLFGGKACGVDHLTRKCNVHHCPINCALSTWSSWTSCSASCKGGFQQRSRSINTYAQYGGKACSSKYSEVQKCNTAPCPAHCQVTSWGPYSPCSKTCGNGRKTRARTVVSKASVGGYVCPSLTESAACNSQACPVDCQLSSKVDGNSCSTSCGGGIKIVRKSILRYPSYGGKKCPAIVETHKCNTNKCPQNCVLSGWSQYGACSRTCGGGVQTRGRVVLAPAAFGGLPCHQQSQVQSCANTVCPTDCKVGAWSRAGACSKTCGLGSKTITRQVLVAASKGGKRCPSLKHVAGCSINLCPTDCTMTNFGSWTTCSKSCGTGQQQRTRTVQQAAANGGAPCALAGQTRLCNTEACPSDCKMSVWGPWSKCTKSCAGGVTTRTRSVVQDVIFGGSVCPKSSETQSCNTKPCPVDCVHGAWSQFSACTKSCGTGKQFRVRNILQDAQYGGRTCGVTHVSTTCNTVACPVNCEVTSWGALSKCSKVCGWGWQVHTRSIAVQPANGGTACPKLQQSHPCSNGPCPVHCTVTPFNVWGPCSKSCSSGIQHRKRTVVSHALSGGYACPYLNEKRACNTQACPLDCKVGAWGAWGACSKKCGGGIQSRARQIINYAGHGGVKCGSVKDSQRCNRHSCPVNCVTGNWYSFGSCSKTCGTGSQTYKRAVLVLPANGGVSCGVLSKTSSCNAKACPVDCTATRWGAVSSCTKSCGSTGIRTRTRSQITAAKNGGKPCGVLAQTYTCNRAACPVNCVLAKYSAWSVCTHKCGGGEQTSTRKVAVNTAFGGKACGRTTRSQMCNMQTCPVDCVISEWADDMVGYCSKTCGAGTKPQVRYINVNSNFGGKACSKDLKRVVACNQKACPIDCKLTAFSAWSKCTKSCNKGTTTRSRKAVTLPGFGGAKCAHLSETYHCNYLACPVDCVAGSWSPWTACSKTCGTGYQQRSRRVSKSAFGGQACAGGTYESKACNSSPCPIDCVFTAFEKWSACSRTCGVGSRSTVRQITVDAAYGGKACPAIVKSEDCNSHTCPTDCQTGAWSAWGHCSKSCGAGGFRSRARSITAAASNGGKSCANTSEKVACNNGRCPIHCQVNSWSAWSKCTKSCAGGKTSRSRSVVMQAFYAGRVCPSLAETVSCNSHKCPVDCVMTQFSAWTKCSKTCGTGQQSRSRQITTSAAFGGINCPSAQAVRKCSVQDCAVDCTVSAYGAYSPCSKSCGGGLKFKNRSVLRASAYGGKTCPTLREAAPCGNGACPADCTVSEYGSWSACTKTCSGGSQLRRRSVLSLASVGGKPCPKLFVTRACNVQTCTSLSDHFYNMKKCSHVKCLKKTHHNAARTCISYMFGKCIKYGASQALKSHHNIIKVQHSGSELHGTAHLCRWEYGQVNGCECRCYDPKMYTDAFLNARNASPKKRVF